MWRECKTKVNKDNEVVTIEVTGDMEEAAVEEMDMAVQKAFGYNPSSILVKFDSRSRINSTGIAILINLIIDSQECGCKVYLTGMFPHFRKIFQLVGLTKYAEIVESEEDVVSANVGS